jgi:hypothetical protein
MALAACSSAPPAPEVQATYPPVAVAAPPALVPPSARAAPTDACGAEPLQSLVGRLRTEIPVPVDPDRWRVACTACPLAQDFRPDRLTILFEAETGTLIAIPGSLVPSDFGLDLMLEFPEELRG